MADKRKPDYSIVIEEERRCVKVAAMRQLPPPPPRETAKEIVPGKVWEHG